MTADVPASIEALVGHMCLMRSISSGREITRTGAVLPSRRGRQCGARRETARDWNATVIRPSERRRFQVDRVQGRARR
jgi:hypothetical protein